MERWGSNTLRRSGISTFRQFQFRKQSCCQVIPCYSSSGDVHSFIRRVSKCLQALIGREGSTRRGRGSGVPVAGGREVMQCNVERIKRVIRQVYASSNGMSGVEGVLRKQ